MAGLKRATPPTESVGHAPSENAPSELAGTLAKLALLHAEAQETARLANLLGRSLYAAIALPLLGALTIALASGVSLARLVVWGGFLAVGSLVMLLAYLRTIGQPFARSALHSFAKDMSAMLLFTGFAWGAGAFLALPAGAGVAEAILFAAVPGIAIAVLLREREAVMLFLAPEAMLAAFAGVLRPFADGALTAGLTLIVCAAIAGATALADRRRVDDLAKPAILSLT